VAVRISLVRCKVVLKSTAGLTNIVEECCGASERVTSKWRRKIGGKRGDGVKMLAEVMAPP
jgi:hypothetical protein